MAKKKSSIWEELKESVEELSENVATTATQASSAASEAIDSVKSTGESISDSVIDTAITAKKYFADGVKTSLVFLSTHDLISWLGKITDAPSTIYDKAMDANYLKTHIGGGNHRLFDEGHTLVGAWEKVREAKSDDTFKEEVIGYASGIWKDITTSKGLPFFTIEKAMYDEWASKIHELVPFVPKSYLYDLLSFDALEVISTGLGAATVLFALSEDDKEKLAEILGSMGILSITSANPIMGLTVIGVAAYSYVIKKREVDGTSLAKGATMSGLSISLFAVMGLPILIEFVIVIAISILFRKHFLDNKNALKLLKEGLTNANQDIQDAVESAINKVG